MHNLNSIFKILVLFSLLFPFSGAFAEARKDLYRAIKKETGVSLKEAFEAVEGKNQPSVDMLKSYSKKVGIKDIESELQSEINARENYCRGKKSVTCEASVENLKSQLSFIKDLYEQSPKLPGIRRLYGDLIIYHYNIKSKVLKADLLDWEKTCSAQEKINTKPCQVKLFETHVLADIASDLSQVAFVKSEKQKIDPSLLTDIKRKIKRYENF